MSPSATTARCSPPQETTARPGSGIPAPARSCGASRQAHRTGVWGPSFSPDGSRLAAVWTGREIVKVFDLATGQAIRRVPRRAARTSRLQSRWRTASPSTGEAPVAVVVDARTGETDVHPSRPHSWTQRCRLEPGRQLDRHIEQRCQRPHLERPNRSAALRAARPRDHQSRTSTGAPTPPASSRAARTGPPSYGASPTGGPRDLLHSRPKTPERVQRRSPSRPTATGS